MSAKEILYDVKARQRLLRGVVTLANIVGVTLEPKGRNVVLRKSRELPKVTSRYFEDFSEDETRE